jgi:hypothetical protein
LASAESRLIASLSRLREMLISAETRRISLLDPTRIAYGRAAAEMVRDLRSGAFAETGTDREAFVAALSAGAARRAGRAARNVAERWEALASDRLDAGMFGHGPEIPTAARDRLESWTADLPSLAEEVSGRSVRRRRRDRLVNTIRCAAVDPGFRPDRKAQRVLDRHPGIVGAARQRLEDELKGIIHADSMRFHERAGAGSPDGLLAKMTVAGGGE